MAFVKKQVLTEKAANPLEIALENQENNTVETIEQVIGSLLSGETDAINQYMQAIAIVEKDKTLKDDLLPTLRDILFEERKHIGQLYSIFKNLPDNAKVIGKGEKEAETGEDENKKEEAITESLSADASTRKFDSYNIETAVTKLEQNNYEVYVQEKEIFDNIYDEADTYIHGDVDAKEVDKFLLSFPLSAGALAALEAEILKTPDPVNERVEEFQDTLDDDIWVLKNLIENGQIATWAGLNRVNMVANSLEKLKTDDYALNTIRNNKNALWRAIQNKDGEYTYKQDPSRPVIL